MKSPQPVNRAGRVRLADLAWALFGIALMLNLILASEFLPGLAAYLVPLRVPLGFAYVLFMPGYLLQSALFPRRADLDGVERFGLSLGLSVAIIPLLALLLDRLPWGLRLLPVVIGQTLLGILLFLAALIRRLLLPSEVAFAPDLRLNSSRWWRGLEPTDRRLFSFAGGALVLAGLAAAWIFLVPSDAEFMTEFYMLGPEGLAENFPRQATVEETLEVTIGVTNRERYPQEYYLEIWQVDPWRKDQRSLIVSTISFSLQVGETRQWEQPWQVEWAGEDQQFEFLLYNGGNPEPYRRLLLWMDISE